jgi:ABC-type histidine transport system ATPase subunit
MKVRGLTLTIGAGSSIIITSTNGTMIGGEFLRCNKLLENLSNLEIYSSSELVII